MTLGGECGLSSIVLSLSLYMAGTRVPENCPECLSLLNQVIHCVPAFGLHFLVK